MVSGYHEATKHTPRSVRERYHRLDWNAKPEPFKFYTSLPPIALPAPSPETGFSAIAASAGTLGERRDLDGPELSRLLIMAAGLRKVVQLDNGHIFYFRNYASAGALYPIEVYVACGGIDGVEVGLYHYNPAEDALRRLRDGDPRAHLLRAAGGLPSVGSAPVSIILSGMPWRTTWKYRERGYRHLFWDAGMILANLLALGAGGGHATEVVMGFHDGELNRLLGLDRRREMALCIAPIGAAAGAPVPATAEGPPDPIDHPSAPLSYYEHEYPEIVEAHDETSLRSIEEARLWHKPGPSSPPAPSRTLCDTGIERTIRRRGSKRVFDPGATTPLAELEGILEHATCRLDCDWGEPLTQVAVIAHGVEGLPAGAYWYRGAFELIQQGDFREKGRFLCLEQPLGGDGAATIFLFADLGEASERLGERGYRAAQLDAGITAGRIYLEAYACRHGATGLTFYDDEARSFFRTTSEPMLVVAVGD